MPKPHQAFQHQHSTTAGFAYKQQPLNGASGSIHMDMALEPSAAQLSVHVSCACEVLHACARGWITQLQPSAMS
jgi:hypothetical protein